MSSRAPCRLTVGRAGRVVLLALLGVCSLGAHSAEIARGDSAWLRRADGEQGGRPLPGPILEAVGAYEGVLSARPESLEARWKLLRALHFAGHFTFQDEESKRGFFDRARDVSEEGVGLLADQMASGVPLEEMDPDRMKEVVGAADIAPHHVARFYFWSAINWGAWSRHAGLLTAVRKGVANRLHEYTLMTIALEPEYDEGGAFRLLGRLHAELPRAPFVSGWVDRDEAIPLMERAYAMAPANPGNRLLLALTLVDLAPDRRDQAIDLLEQVGSLTPRPSMRIEDLAMRGEARDRLAVANVGERN